MDENKLWMKLYEERALRLKSCFEQTQRPHRKARFLEKLDTFIGHLEERVKDPTRSRYGSLAYLSQIEEPRTVRKIKKLLENPDNGQIDRLLGKINGREISSQLEISYETYRTILKRIRKHEGITDSYPAAKIAHWLLNQGYELK